MNPSSCLAFCPGTLRFSLINLLVQVPDPPWPDDGPVLLDGVLPDLNVQSNLSDVSCFHPEHKPLSKLHVAKEKVEIATKRQKQQYIDCYYLSA